MQVDVLRSPLNNAFAVNCEIEDNTITCGALYLAPRIQTPLMRLAYETVSVDVELPSELLNRPDALRAWSVTFPIRQ